MTLNEKLPYLLLAIKKTCFVFAYSILLVFCCSLLSVLRKTEVDFLDISNIFKNSKHISYDMCIQFFNLKALSILLIILIIYYFNFLKLINKNLNKIINNDQVINDYILKISKKYKITKLLLSFTMIAIYGFLDSKRESIFEVMIYSFSFYPIYSYLLSVAFGFIALFFYLIVKIIFNVIFKKELKEQ